MSIVCTFDSLRPPPYHCNDVHHRNTQRIQVKVNTVEISLTSQVWVNFTFDGVLWILKYHLWCVSSNITSEVVSYSPVKSVTFVCMRANVCNKKTSFKCAGRCVCTHAHTHTYIQTHTHTHIHTHIHTHSHTHKHTQRERTTHCALLTHLHYCTPL